MIPVVRAVLAGRRRAVLRSELRAIWAEVLGRPVAPGDQFFELGGGSLEAVRIASRAEERLGVPVSVRLILESRSLAEMAAELEVLTRARQDVGGGRP